MAHTYKNIMYIYPYSLLAVWVISAMWQSYLFSDIQYVWSDIGVETLYTYTYTFMHVSIHAYISTCTQHILMYALIHKFMNTYIYTY